MLKKFKKWFDRQHWTVKGIVYLLIPVLIAIYLWERFSRGTEKVFVDKDKVFELDKNPDGTQKLPDTPGLDETLDDILEHINERPKGTQGSDD